MKLQGAETDLVVDGVRGEMTSERQERTFRGDGNVLYFDCSGDYMTVCLSKFTELYSQKGDFYCM